MKKFFFLILLSIFFLSEIVQAWDNDVYVNGYQHSDGTYVRPHYKSHPDGDVFNNWSTKENINPYTRKRGTRDLWKELNRRGIKTEVGEVIKFFPPNHIYKERRTFRNG